MKITRHCVLSFLRSEAADSTIEYVLVAALLALAALAALHDFEKKLTKNYNTIGKKV